MKIRKQIFYFSKFLPFVNFGIAEKKYLDVFIHINGSKVCPGVSSFIFNSKYVAVNNVNDLRLIFNRSYISTKRVYIKVPPVA